MRNTQNSLRLRHRYIISILSIVFILSLIDNASEAHESNNHNSFISFPNSYENIYLCNGTFFEHKKKLKEIISKLYHLAPNYSLIDDPDKYDNGRITFLYFGNDHSFDDRCLKENPDWLKIARSVERENGIGTRCYGSSVPDDNGKIKYSVFIMMDYEDLFCALASYAALLGVDQNTVLELGGYYNEDR